MVKSTILKTISTITYLFLLLLLPSILFAQTGLLKGHVFDKNTNEPLFGANVIIEKTSLGVATDPEGNYSIRGIPSGSYSIKVSYIGYISVSKEIEIVQGMTLEENFLLDPQALAGETVLITAQARGQNEAINQQLSARTIKNVVASEKIRELPDASAATALSRLPGLSLQDGDKVVIRGVQAKMNMVLVNGIQLPSTDLTDRSTNLGFISSNMLSGIEVTKVVTPDMDANSIGGVVNLKLKEAPEDFHFDVMTQGSYNSQDRTLPVQDNYQMWGSVSDRFLENKLGVFLQGNARKSFGGKEIAQATFAGMGPGGFAPYGQETYGMTQFQFSDEDSISTDYGVSLIVDYLLPNGKLVLLNSASFNNTDLARYRDLFNIAAQETRKYTLARDVFDKQLIINALHGENIFGDLKIEYGASHSLSTKRTDIRYGDENEIPGFDFFASQNINAYPHTDEAARLALTTDDVLKWPLDPNNYNGATLEQFAGIRNEKYDERLLAAHLDLTLPVSFSSNFTSEFKIGGKINYSKRENDVERKYIRAVQPGSNGGAVDWLNSIGHGDVPLQMVYFKNYDYKRGDYYLDGAHKMDQVLRTDYMDKWFRLATPGWPRHLTDSHQNDFSGKEYVTAGYLMGIFKVGPLLSVIAGGRYEHYNMDYKATFIFITHTVDGVAKILDTLNTANRSRDDFFPNFQVHYKATEWFDIRLAYSKTLSRPDYRAILPNTVVDVGSGTGIAGNPTLKPAISQNFDTYLSFYDNTIGLFTIGGFYKKIDDVFFQSGRLLRALPSGTVFPDSAAFAELGLLQLNSTALITTYMNNPRPAYIKGIEVEWQTHFWYLPSPLNLMVLNVNYTRIWSEMEYQQIRTKEVLVPGPRPSITLVEVDTFRTARLLNQGDHVLNIALGTDYKGFSGRISFRLQGNVITSVGARPENDTYTGDIYGWDFTISQKLPIEGLSLFLNGINVTHSPQKDYQDFRRVVGGPILQNLSRLSYSPSWYELGIRYSL